MIIVEIVVALGLVAVMLALYDTNRGRVVENGRKIEEQQRFLNKIDKKLDILITTLEIKYPQAFERAKKQNGKE